jgi:hypothetical protein
MKTDESKLEVRQGQLNIPVVSGSLPKFKDWGYIQEEAYDECMDKLISDDTPITAFIEWLQKKYPNGVIINYN